MKDKPLNEKEVEASLKGEKIIGTFFPYMFVKEAVERAEKKLKEEIDNKIGIISIPLKNGGCEFLTPMQTQKFTNKLINKIWKEEFGGFS